MIDRDLLRRASAEAVGAALLVAIVIGSGIAAQRLSPGDAGLQLLENSTATGAGLVALILALGTVSGAHFNPVVTLADRMLGGTSTRDAGVYVCAQVVGACVGAVVANLMFGLSAVNLSTHTRSGGDIWLGEFVATFGLLLVILGVVRSGRSSVTPYAVGGYIAAAYWFTSSTSFANPAVTVARTLSDTFAGIRPSSVPMFVVLEIAGALVAVGLAVLAPDPEVRRPRRAGIGMTRRPEVLFVCVHNAGRSQMAAALLDHHGRGRVRVRSAGSEPADEINPAVVAAMEEIGLDISREYPKPLVTGAVASADVVVTMGCGDACPVFTGKRYLDWELDDPAGKALAEVRPIRDEIDRRVRALVAELVAT